MKKLLLIFGIGLLSAGSVSAQTWLAGVRGGLLASNVGGDYSDEFTVLPGVTVGLFSEYKTGDRAGFFLDLLYARKGANYDGNAGGLSDARMKLQYIDIPVALIFYPTEKFGMYTGPQVSILIDSEFKDGETEFDYDNIIEANDYGVVGGFRYRATDRLHFDLRYYHSFSDLSTLNVLPEDLTDDQAVDSNDYIRTAYLTVSYGLFYRP